MSAAEIQLRTATFGGFQKQDVLNYIETANREHLERVESLRQELNEAVRAKNALEEQTAAGQERESLLSGRVEGLEKEAAEAARTAETLKSELAGAREQLAQAETRLVETRALLEQTQAQLAQAQACGQQWESAALAYESLKDRTAGIELEAHHRAQGIQTNAEAKAAAIRGETSKWLAKVQLSYNQMRADLARTVANSSNDLERVRRTLQELNSEFARQSDTFDTMVDTYREDSASKAADPQPVNDAM